MNSDISLEKRKKNLRCVVASNHLLLANLRCDYKSIYVFNIYPGIGKLALIFMTFVGPRLVATENPNHFETFKITSDRKTDY